MSYIRHHVIGDYKYGDFKINNKYKNLFGVSTQLLHSFSIKFSDLNGKFSYLNGKIFEAKIDEKFNTILKQKE